MNRSAVLAAGGAIAGIAASLATLSNRQVDIARATACQGCLSCIAVAMQDYHERHGHFPPAFVIGKDGKPAHSWRVLLLESLDMQTYQSYRFDEPWDGPNNKKLLSKMPSCYACPADFESKVDRRTNYFVVVGSNTAFPGPEPIKISDIKRPQAETLLVVEATGQSILWMEPKDLTFDSMSYSLNDPERPSVSSKHRSKSGAIMADGSKRWLSDVTPERLREMLLTKMPDGK